MYFQYIFSFFAKIYIAYIDFPVFDLLNDSDYYTKMDI